MNQISPRQLIINYLEKMDKSSIHDNDDDIKSDNDDNDEYDIGDIIENIKCITLGAVDDELFDLLLKFHFRDNESLRDIKLEQYKKWKDLNIAKWVWSFGKILNKFSYNNLW